MSAAETGDEEGGGGNTSISVTINGGNNTIGSAEDVSVSTTVTNITSGNTTVYVSGDYYENPVYLFYPRISEMHITNNTSNALWNPTTKELPGHLYASVMKQAGISILYDGWIDLEHRGSYKPEGASREGEILGYDIYARLGEVYTPVKNSYTDEVDHYIYETGGLYTTASEINLTWAITQLYRAVGIEKSQFYVLTDEAPPEYDVNRSPIAQLITMETMGPDLSAAISNITATRTDPAPYLELAIKDGLGLYIEDDRESQTISIADFCTLAYSLMQIYGEPVLTPQETYMLLDVYGAELPYGLSPLQLESIKYLMARGIITSDLDWRENLKFGTASEILMRIKDKDSRLTFKEVTLTTDVELLAKGYYSTEISTQISPIQILGATANYALYTEYDYFIEVLDNIQFKSESGYMSIPFIAIGEEYSQGVNTNLSYMGRVTVDGGTYYHFRAPQTLDSISKLNRVYVNTPVNVDAPAKYSMPLPSGGNVGGFWTYTGDKGATPGCTNIVSDWVWAPLDSRFPAEYCDKARKEASIAKSEDQLSILNASSYGYSFRVYEADLGSVKFKDSTGADKSLSDIAAGEEVTLKDNMKIKRLDTLNRYAYFEVTGCQNADSLTEILTCAGKGVGSYQSFPAFAKHDGRYLVSIDYLKAIGVVWEFAQTGDGFYYIGVNVAGTTRSTVYLGTSGKNAYIIRGSQLTLFDEDTITVLETDTGYFVDYAAVLGVSTAVSFPTSDGNITLSTSSALDGVDVNARIYNMNSANGTPGDTTKHSETAATVDVTRGGEVMKYVYCPVDYALANWLVVDNKVDVQQGIFTFYAAEKNGTHTDATGAEALEQMLGITSGSTCWDTYYTVAKPIIVSSLKLENGAYSFESDPGSWPELAYIQEQDAFLVRTNHINPDTELNYGSFVNAEDKSAFVSSIFYTGSGLVDWNYNIYDLGKEGWSRSHVWRYRSVNDGEILLDLSDYVSGEVKGTSSETVSGFTSKTWLPAPAGIPGMIGNPVGVPALALSSSSHIYSGIAYRTRGGANTAAAFLGKDEEAGLNYCLLHATPNKVILQSCAFSFSFLEDSPLNPNRTKSVNLQFGSAIAGFDWDAFFKEVNLQSLDELLSLLIIMVLAILPRIFMFVFIILMALSLLADAKPWRKFCESIFDPYKFLTAGRQTVHTIQIKRLVLYSFIALCLYGLFQNGLILDIFAWVARAVSGILIR